MYLKTYAKKPVLALLGIEHVAIFTESLCGAVSTPSVASRYVLLHSLMLFHTFQANVLLYSFLPIHS